MFPHVTAARHVADYRVFLRFDDGLEGELDLADELVGPIFEPLLDLAVFASFQVEGWTLCWPNGADLSPEFLHRKLQAAVAA